MDLVNSSATKFHSAEIKARAWLRQAHQSAKRKGFCHSRWMFLPEALAWTKPYAETSGYLIENLLDNDSENNWALGAAMDTGHWLAEIQSEEGYFHSGIEFRHASSFNTAQILLGFRAILQKQPDDPIRTAMDRATNWLLSQIDQNGRWTRGLYSEGHFPAYYSRAIWPLLDLAVNDSRYPVLLKSLNLLWSCKKDLLYFEPCNFKPGQNSLSHTIAYALEGFWESAVILDRMDILESSLSMLEHSALEYLNRGRLWAEISPSGQRIYSYRCLTGEAQFSALMFKAYLKRSNTVFLESGIRLLEDLCSSQIVSRNPGLHGAFPASVPVYGSYFPFRCVNWTSKFFLDAIKLYHICVQTP